MPLVNSADIWCVYHGVPEMCCASKLCAHFPPKLLAARYVVVLWATIKVQATTEQMSMPEM